MQVTDEPTTTAPSGSTWIFSALSACLVAGYGVLFTVVADYRGEFGVGESTVGLVIGLGFLSAFVSQLVIAPIADRGHAKSIVVFGVLLNVVGLLLMGFGTAIEMVVFGRIVSGIGIGAGSPAIRRIVIVADPENLGRNLGWLLSAEVFGFAMGPAVSAVLVPSFGLGAPFLAISAFTLLLLPIVVRIARTDETVPVDAPKQRLALDLLTDSGVAAAVMLGAGAFLMIGGFDALWDVVHEDLGTSDWIANLGITLFALPLIVLGPVSGKMAQRTGPYRLASVGLLLGAAFMVSYGALPTGLWIFAFAMGHALTDGLTIAAGGVAIGMAVSNERQAGAQGLMGAAQALTAGATAIVIGVLYESAGRLVAYVAIATGIVVCVAVSWFLSRETRARFALERARNASSPVLHTSRQES